MNDRGPAATSPAAGLSLRARALRHLSLREHTRRELARKLVPYATETDDLDALLDDLVTQGWLSDERAADSLVHRLGVKQGVQRVRQALRDKGVSPDVAQAALASLQSTERERAVAVWRRKFGQVPADAKERARQLRFLMARGFDAGLVRQVVDGGRWGDDEPDPSPDD